MDSNVSDDIKISGNDDAPKYSPTSINIKIKTRDSQHTLRICKCIPVPSLKEQIGVFTGVSSYQQQLVFRGTDLRDDKLLSDYHVEDGDTIGLIVISDPPQDGGSSSGQHQGNNCSEQETQEAVLPERSPVICALPAGHNNGASDSSTRPDLSDQHGHSNNNSRDSQVREHTEQSKPKRQKV
nr:ubiquitin-like domain-containing protein CIP73 [Ipomoea batatas]